MAFVVGVGSGRVDSRGSGSVATCAHDTESGIGRKVSVGVFSLAAAAMIVVAPASVDSAINAKFPPIDRTNPNRLVSGRQSSQYGMKLVCRLMKKRFVVPL
mmetsp:Transcript_10071/g.42341  ORF Transcript_10071/g.42341 Transcript_10071/m.42341 type:complete len:101 (-) Transcript_10071:713-1015(-)